jgi:hypothetical protein
MPSLPRAAFVRRCREGREPNKQQGPCGRVKARTAPGAESGRDSVDAAEDVRLGRVVLVTGEANRRGARPHVQITHIPRRGRAIVGFWRKLLPLGLLWCHRELLVSGEPGRPARPLPGRRTARWGWKRAVRTRWRRGRNRVGGQGRWRFPGRAEGIGASLRGVPSPPTLIPLRSGHQPITDQPVSRAP